MKEDEQRIPEKVMPERLINSERETKKCKKDKTIITSSDISRKTFWRNSQAQKKFVSLE